MASYKLLVAGSATALFLVHSGVTLGEPANSLFKVSTVTEQHTPSNADALAMRARAYVNPLEAPDTSNVVAEAADGRHIQGAMTKDGLVNLDSASTRAFGSFGIPYTTTRVQDGNRSVDANDDNRLGTTFPYRATGKMTFSVGAGSAHCTATVIRRGLILTAAHCLQDFGAGNETFSNFEFRPGHYGADGATSSQFSPHGVWTPFTFIVTSSWSDGTDIGCGAARENDVALLAMNTQEGSFIGDEVGYQGYGWNAYSFVSSENTGNLNTGAVSTLGYPGLMDAGAIMQRTDGPTYTTTVCDAPQLMQGSNLTGGASGGPWIVNFSGRNAALSGGATPGIASIMAVIGVTSWGSADPNEPKDNYSSLLGQNSLFPAADYGGYGAGNIGAFLNFMCGLEAPEGGTLAANGYCD